MFSKNSDKMDSLIGARSEFQGEFVVKGTLRVDGRVDGRVNADCVIVSETAVIKGEVTAQRIVVDGKIEGNLRAQEIVEIKASGKVLGDIFTNKFSIIKGGEFNGKVEMKMVEKKVSDFEPKNPESQIVISETVPQSSAPLNEN
jgi:cytoskeletal protein CcmA (bactofilin family)